MNREQIMEALKALIVAQGRFVTVSRKLKTWDQVPSAEQPACFITEHSEGAGHQSENLAKVTLMADIFLYSRADEPNDIPVSILNADLAAIDAAIAPVGRDLLLYKRQTLGGLVSHCFVDGETIKLPGDDDNQNVAVVPIKILVP